jgi:sugar phosphate isomerase/epimerase
MSKMRVALQLYTVRDEMAKNVRSTLKAVAEMGYKAVQVSGMYDLSADEMKSILDENGLEVAGTHEGLDDLSKDIKGVLKRNAVLGSPWIVLPWSQAMRDGDVAAIEDLARQADGFGKACKEAGFGFGYHNHNFEFRKVNGRSAMDILLEKTSPELVTVELDVGWCWYAGENPAEWVRKLKGRVPLLHAKDHDKENKDVNRPVGDGALDWEAIFAAAEEAGTKWVFVEEDRTVLPPLSSVARSLKNLQAMGLE